MKDKYYINSIGIECRKPLKHSERMVSNRIATIIIALSILSTAFIIIFYG